MPTEGRMQAEPMDLLKSDSAVDQVLKILWHNNVCWIQPFHCDMSRPATMKLGTVDARHPLQKHIGCPCRPRRRSLNYTFHLRSTSTCEHAVGLSTKRSLSFSNEAESHVICTATHSPTRQVNRPTVRMSRNAIG